jgi:hypothetical protein
MATSRYKFYEDVQNVVTGTAYKGFPLNEAFSSMFSTSKDIMYEIPLKFQYRPDLIANYFYGTSSYYWVLVNANNIENSPEGFEVGVKITIPYISRIMELL